MEFKTYTNITQGRNNFQIKLDKNLNEDKLPQHLIDPYLRRYHIIKYGVEAVTVGLTIWGGKLLIENVTLRRYKKISPWLQVGISSYYFAYQLARKFFHDIQADDKLYEAIKRQYHKSHYFNSQYWH